jgi:hypothetical protein
MTLGFHCMLQNEPFSRDERGPMTI